MKPCMICTVKPVDFQFQFGMALCAECSVRVLVNDHINAPSGPSPDVRSAASSNPARCQGGAADSSSPDPSTTLPGQLAAGVGQTSPADFSEKQ
jgi:hypothetical protein